MSRLPPMPRLTRAALLAAMALLAGPASAQGTANPKPPAVDAAGGVKSALHAIEIGEFVRAASELTPLADAGDAEAQYLLGLLNEAGVLPGSNLSAPIPEQRQ